MLDCCLSLNIMGPVRYDGCCFRLWDPECNSWRDLPCWNLSENGIFGHFSKRSCKLNIFVTLDFIVINEGLHEGGICTHFIVCVFSSRQKNMNKIVQKSTPPPSLSLSFSVSLSLSVSKQCRIAILENWNTVCGVCVFWRCSHKWRGRGRRGGLSWTCFKPCFPACGKTHREMF